MNQPVLTIDIGGTKTIVGIGTTGGEMLQDLRAGRPPDKDAFWIRDSLFERIDRLKSEHPETFSAIRHCGIGFGGPVRDNHPVVSIHVKGWEEIDLCGDIQSRYGLLSCMENDGIVQALGEHVYGAGKGRGSLIFANLGTGYGGGIIEEGKPRLGDGGFAGHFGHVCVVPNGRKCPCGNEGCAEAYCSGSGIGRTAEQAAEIETGEADALRARIAQLPAGPSHALLSLAREGDEYCLRWVDQTLEWLSLALSAGVNILDIRLIVIGGGAGLALSHWSKELLEKVSPRILSLCREGLEIREAALGDYSLSLGAVALTRIRLGHP